MMQIDIVRINPEGDGVTALYIDGGMHIYGDYYHDKIDNWVEGFLAGLRRADADVSVRTWEVSGRTKLSREVCEDAAPPPGLLEEYPKKQLKRV